MKKARSEKTEQTRIQSSSLFTRSFEAPRMEFSKETRLTQGEFERLPP